METKIPRPVIKGYEVCTVYALILLLNDTVLLNWCMTGADIAV